MINKLNKIFLDIGLTKKESIILEVLFYYSHLKAVDIANKTKIHRTTVYAVLKSLQKKGLVSTVSIYGITEFQAIDIKLFPSYIQRQKESLDKKIEEIQSIMPQLENIRSAIESFPKVSFFEGVEGVKQAYEGTLDDNKNKEMYVFSGPDIVFKEMGKEYVEYYVKRRTQLGIKSFQIAPNTPWGKFIHEGDKKCLRITKLIPENFSFDTEIVLYDNKMGIFSFSKEKLMAVIVEDTAITNTMLSLFKYIDSTLSQT
jgi:sugar-specific transcriptional regulator TrmB